MKKFINNKPAELYFGLSVSTSFHTYRVIYTVGSKSKDKIDHDFMINNPALLIRIGQFCLKNILATLHIPGLQNEHNQQEPQLKLVVNNKVPYETIT